MKKKTKTRSKKTKTKTSVSAKTKRVDPRPVLKVGTKVKFKTSTRWGSFSKTVKIIGIVPRAASVKIPPSYREFAFRGSREPSGLNHRYLVVDDDGFVTAPRATTLNRAAAK